MVKRILEFLTLGRRGVDDAAQADDASKADAAAGDPIGAWPASLARLPKWHTLTHLAPTTPRKIWMSVYEIGAAQ